MKRTKIIISLIIIILCLKVHGQFSDSTAFYSDRFPHLEQFPYNSQEEANFIKSHKIKEIKYYLLMNIIDLKTNIYDSLKNISSEKFQLLNQTTYDINGYQSFYIDNSNWGYFIERNSDTIIYSEFTDLKKNVDFTEKTVLNTLGNPIKKIYESENSNSYSLFYYNDDNFLIKIIRYNLDGNKTSENIYDYTYKKEIEVEPKIIKNKDTISLNTYFYELGNCHYYHIKKIVKENIISEYIYYNQEASDECLVYNIEEYNSSSPYIPIYDNEIFIYNNKELLAEKYYFTNGINLFINWSYCKFQFFYNDNDELEFILKEVIDYSDSNNSYQELYKCEYEYNK